MTEQTNKERFINIDEVEHRTGLKKTAIYEQMKKGLFPENINISLNRVVWLESEINDWIAEKIRLNRG